MKVAIIGHNPSAIEALHFFDQLGAYCTAFFNPMEFEKQVCGLPDSIQIELQTRLSDLDHLSFKPQDIIRIQKKFLKKGQIPEGRSRLADLFRVVYLTKASEESLKLFENITEEMKESLLEGLENYEDFDLIVDCQSVFDRPAFINGDDSKILNETRGFVSQKIKYGADALGAIIKDELPQKVLIVGESWIELDDTIIKKFEDHLQKSPSHKLHLLDQNEVFSELIKKSEERLSIERDEFQKKLHDWRGLEDYEKVKVSQPSEPTSQIIDHKNIRAQSVDRLSDKEALFVTVEEFNLDEGGELKTLELDEIFVLNPGRVSEDKTKSLEVKRSSDLIHEDEPGFYRFFWDGKKLNFQEEFAAIEKEIKKYFSKGPQ